MLFRPSSLSCQLERAKHTIHQPLDRQPLRQLKGICFAIGLWIVEHERWKSIENFGQKFLQRMRRSFTASKQISVLASMTRTSTLLYKIDSKFWFPISQEKFRRFLAIAGHFWNQNARIFSFSKRDNRLTASFSWIGGKELPVFHNVYSLYPPRPFFLGTAPLTMFLLFATAKKVLNVSMFFEFLPFPSPYFSEIGPRLLSQLSANNIN